MAVKRLPALRTSIKGALVCATALASVASIAHADELSDLKKQTNLLQRQNQALMRRIEGIERTQRTRQPTAQAQGGPAGAAQASAAASNSRPSELGNGGTGPLTTSQFPSGNATSEGRNSSRAGTPTVAEDRTASAAPAAAAIGGTPPVPAAGGLTYRGVTLYGAIDLGVEYQTHGTPLNSVYGNGVEELIQRNSNKSVVSLVPNALSFSNIGLRGVEPILPDLAAVFNVQTSFVPTSGTLSNGPGSLVQNNGVALNRQSSNGDSSRAGQAFNATAYAGLSSARFGTLTFGRQNAFTLDGIIAYDPLFASNAFSVIGYSGVPAGGGDTEDARFDSSIKYLVNVGPVHGGAIYQLAGENGRSVNAANTNPRGNFQLDLGAEYAGLNVDGIYSQTYGSVAAAALSTTQVLTSPVGTLAGTVSDNQAFQLLAKYRIGPVQLFAGYENILYSNPRNPLGQGSTTQGGYILSVINNTAYNNNRLFQIYWGGLRYAITPRFSVNVGYYREHQSSYALVKCFNTSLGTCRGDLNAGSLLFDWRLSPRFDVYAGAMYSEVSNGLASGFLYNNTIDPTIGTRFAF